MNYKGHRTCGIVIAIPVAIIACIFSGCDWITTLVCAFTAFWFALYPDLDIASKPSRYAYIVGIPTSIYLIYTEHILQGILTILFITVPKIFPHRGLVHTLKFGLLASLCWIYMIEPFVDINTYFVGVSAMLGFVTHLILDRHIRI